jgi:hypothetical protein
VLGSGCGQVWGNLPDKDNMAQTLNKYEFTDTVPRYAPARVMITGHGLQPVTRSIFYPAGQHPAGCFIREEMGVLALHTPHGSRWYGCDHAFIDSSLRIVVIGCDSRDEVRTRWEVANG